MKSDKYRFLRFEKSKKKGKKYTAVLQDKNTEREVKVHFGQKGYEHYKDSTGLGIWSHLNHLDKDRRKRYLQRASGIRDGEGKLTKDNILSPNYWSINYLW